MAKLLLVDNKRAPHCISGIPSWSTTTLELHHRPPPALDPPNFISRTKDNLVTTWAHKCTRQTPTNNQLQTLVDGNFYGSFLTTLHQDAPCPAPALSSPPPAPNFPLWSEVFISVSLLVMHDSFHANLSR
eukprot:5195898-Ditylum_brightwellii.AAC.1